MAKQKILNQFDMNEPFSEWVGDKGKFWIKNGEYSIIGHINHNKKTVSPVHGYYGKASGKLQAIAKELNYKYSENTADM